MWWLYDASRILKDGGTLLCFCRWDVQEAFKTAIEWSGLRIKSQIVWDRALHGMGDTQSAFAPQHDVIWFAVKGKYKFPGKRPKSVIRVKRINGRPLVHPTEKPVELMSMLISMVNPPGGTVLDPFAGSGSTLVASRNLGVDATGIEIDCEYVELIRERLRTEIF